MKDREKEIISLANKKKLYGPESDASHERTLKTLDKVKRNDQLFHEGYSLGANNSDISKKIELVEENGKMIPKNKHRNFMAGYKSGLEAFRNGLSSLMTVNKNKSNNGR